MSLRALVTVLSLALRLLQQINALRSPRAQSKTAPAARPGSRLLSRLASRALSRAAAPDAPVVMPAPVPQSRRARRGGWFGQTLRMLLAACVAGTMAFVVVRQQRRRVARRRPVHAPFPEELLDVLAPPGGNGHFFYTGGGLLDPDTDAFYPVVDGIPDFGGPAVVGQQHAARSVLRSYETDGWLVEVYDPLVYGLVVPCVWRGSKTGAAALAGAVVAEAYDGWCLSTPCGTGLFEIEMAQANPHAKIICLDGSWEMLLEARRKALEAGLANLYFVRGDAQLLPLKTAVFDSAWSANGLHLYPRLEQAITQLARVARPGAVVAGVSLIPGGPPLADFALRLRAHRMPGLRDVNTHLSLLAAAGLRDLSAVRDGAMVRFLGTRAG